MTLNCTGSIRTFTHRSRLLVGNRAGVAVDRPVLAYVPREAEVEGARFPVLYCLASWTNAGRTQFHWRPFREALPERLDRLVLQQQMPACVVVCVDLYTAFGGSQYVNSEYFGPHGDYITQELVPFVEANLPVQTGPEHRGVFGISSGGFGAVRLAMDYPGFFAAAASHAGDVGFDLVYGGDLVHLPKHLARYEGKVSKFLDYCAKATKISGGDIHALMLLGMAGFYSPNSKAADGFDLPIDLFTGEVDQSVWKKWLEHDPLHRCSMRAEALKTLKLLYIECGLKDEYNLLYGTRQMHKKLEKLGVPHLYSEFDDGHSGIEYRFDLSLPKLVNAIV